MDEVQRIKIAYSQRKKSTNDKYSHFYLIQREEAIRQAVVKNALIPLCDKKILDLGCGDGAILSYFLREGVPQENLYGIDILSDRIETAKKLNPRICFICGNAANLPYPDMYFDIVTQATMFTSILDESMRKLIAAEMCRVLKPKGTIIWHDFRFNNPLNNQVRGISKKEIINLYSGCQFEFKLVNLNPFIARYLIKISWKLCKILEKISLLCTHWFIIIKK